MGNRGLSTSGPTILRPWADRLPQLSSRGGWVPGSWGRGRSAAGFDFLESETVGSAP